MVSKNLTIILFIAVVFTAGLIVGINYSAHSNDKISSTLQDNELSAESFVIEQELLEGLDVSCPAMEARLNSLGSELWALGKQLDSPTAKALGEDNYQIAKRQYHLTQARTYVIFYKMLSKCKPDSHVLLYYYSQNQTASAQQGKILDDLVDKLHIHVFAMEYQYSPDLKFLEDYYEINQTPAIVVDYKNTLRGLVSGAEIEKELQ